MPLAEDTTEGPTTELSFLGICPDSSHMTVSLAQDELQSARSLVQQVAGLKAVRDGKSIESLVGHLVHATKVCPLGKALHNCLFSLSSGMKRGQVRICNCEAHAELAWWHTLLSNWSSLSVHQFLLLRQPDQHLFSDASGSWGCGAWCLPQRLQVPWPRDTECAIQDPSWRGQLIVCHSYNMAVVS